MEKWGLASSTLPLGGQVAVHQLDLFVVANGAPRRVLAEKI
jgi:hypothetical protein